MMIDVDHFKLINDVRGHLGGDAVLAELGRVLSTLVSSFDHVRRYSGERFAILLPDTPAKEALAMGESICHAIPQQAGVLQGVTVSIGVASWAHEMPGNTLVEIADAGLRRAKDNGRNQAILGTGLKALLDGHSPLPSVLDRNAGVDTFIA